MTAPVLSATFAATSATVQIGQAITATPFSVGTQVFLFATGEEEATVSPPAPFALNTPYYVVSASGTQTVTLSATPGGGAITATASGSCGIASSTAIGYDNSPNAILAKDRARPPTNIPLPFQTYQAQSISIGAAKTGSTGFTQTAAPPGNAPATVPAPSHSG
jgi:hypothetical protein